MTVKSKTFQPGAILHQVIAGTFVSNGMTFERWCAANGVHPSTARNATHGQSGGNRGVALLNKMIDDAGREEVSAAYDRRMMAEARLIEMRGQVA